MFVRLDLSSHISEIMHHLMGLKFQNLGIGMLESPSEMDLVARKPRGQEDIDQVDIVGASIIQLVRWNPSRT